MPWHYLLHCTHIKGHGGLKATVSALQAPLPDYRYVMKTDVKRYYESIDQTILLRQLDKTFIEHIEKGFGFLGYRFGLPELDLAEKMIINAVNKVLQLYEQKQTVPKRAVALDNYITAG
jgi:hypothetical protein